MLQDQLHDESRLFGRQTRTRLYEPQYLADKRPIPMTLGWHIGELGDDRYYYKEGGGGGFHSMMRLYPEQRIGSVVMVNATGFDVRHFLDANDQRFFAKSR